MNSIKTKKLKNGTYRVVQNENEWKLLHVQCEIYDLEDWQYKIRKAQDAIRELEEFGIKQMEDHHAMLEGITKQIKEQKRTSKKAGS